MTRGLGTASLSPEVEPTSPNICTAWAMLQVCGPLLLEGLRDVQYRGPESDDRHAVLEVKVEGPGTMLGEHPAQAHKRAGLRARRGHSSSRERGVVEELRAEPARCPR